jgi:hypothetical protein
MADEALTLQQIGEAVWGTHWLAEMGKAIGVGDRSMRTWASDHGAPQIPPSLEDDLHDALQARIKDINGVLERLAKVGIDRRAAAPQGFQTQVYSTMRKPGEHRKR